MSKCPWSFRFATASFVGFTLIVLLGQAADELPIVPLYRRTLTYAMKRKVQLVQWPNDAPELRWLRSQ